jgi:WD40 repeat protein
MGGEDRPGVYALAVGPDGSLYAGGYFTTAGGVSANRIARWDGVQWHPLGSGMDVDYPYAYVFALAFGPDGSLYAGGRFTTAGGVAANSIARWDGSQWYSLSSGMDYGVGALAINPIDGSLYAGGDFTTAGGITANHIARWDGAQWQPLGSGMEGGDTSCVFALAFSPDGTLYAGGDFTTAGGVTADYVARWDGAQWQPLGNGIKGAYYPGVSALAFGPDSSLYVGGNFSIAGDTVANKIARWDGTQWHRVSAPTGNGVSSYIRTIAPGSDGSLYAGGDFKTAGGVIANYIARWDGAQWHRLGSGTNGSVSAAVVGPDGSLYAGGRFTTAGGVEANSIARWDGVQWHPLGSGVTGTYYQRVSALAVGPDGSLYAGGDFTTAGGVPTNYIARWDGSQWHPLGSGVGGGDDPRVHALAFGPDGSLYAGGYFTTAGGVAANSIARWDGFQWYPLDGGMGGAYPSVSALAVGPDGSLYAGGSFTTAGWVAANSIARWDGFQWYPLDGGTGGAYPSVSALAVGPDGSLYAGGRFTTAGGVAANDIARWDGVQWHPLSSGMGGGYGVYALAAGSNGSLYAGGFFTTAGGVAANNIAQWNRVVSPPAIWFPIVYIDQ